MPFIVEMVVCAWHAPPFIDTTVNVALDARSLSRCPSETRNINGRSNRDALSLFVFLKLYITVRYLLTHAHSQGIKHLIRAFSDFEIGLEFTLKSLLHTKPLKVLFSLFTLMFLTSVYAFGVCERADDHGYGSFVAFADGAYYAIITLTTVGFGDISANTRCGRVVSSIMALAAVLYTAILVAIINKKIPFNREELRFFRLFQKKKWHNKFKRCAATAIQAAWRCYASNKRLTKKLVSRMHASNGERKLLMSLQKWQSIRRTLNAAFQEKDHMVVPMVENILVQNSQIMAYTAMLDEGMQIVEEDVVLNTQRTKKIFEHLTKLEEDRRGGSGSSEVEARLKALEASMSAILRKLDGIQSRMAAPSTK